MGRAGAMAARIRQALLDRSWRLIVFLDVRIEALISVWIVVTVTAGVWKVIHAPIPPRGPQAFLIALLPYLLMSFAPIAGYRVTAGSFPRGLISAQPTFRLARLGRWKHLDVMGARAHPAYGPAGFMASLAFGILLNVPVRTAEFLTAMPLLDEHAPVWARLLFHAMTIDVVVMNFFYMVCFVMAVRTVPLFPRAMLLAWAADIVLQLFIAREVARAPGLPHAVSQSLLYLLKGNIDKVLISGFVWLPYLLLSERVNVTYRQRRSRDGDDKRDQDKDAGDITP